MALSVPTLAVSAIVAGPATGVAQVTPASQFPGPQADFRKAENSRLLVDLPCLTSTEASRLVSGTARGYAAAIRRIGCPGITARRWRGPDPSWMRRNGSPYRSRQSGSPTPEDKVILPPQRPPTRS